MNEKQPNSKQDPRLKSFMRQAGAIITAERGLNAASRVKLQTLADHLKLPQELLEQAIQRLQRSEALANLTRYERSYLEFLAAEFEQLTGGVLSPGMEQKAIEHARSKYQINGTRAEQLIQAQAEIDGIARISPADSFTFARQFIVDRIGDSTVVDDELLDELYRIAKKWAVNQTQVDRIVAQQVRKNRDFGKTSWLVKLSPLVGLTALLIALGIVATKRGWISGEKPVPTKTDGSSQTVDNGDTAASFFWLPTDVIDQLDEIKSSTPKVYRSLERLDDPSPTQQSLGFRELANWMVESDDSASNIRALIAQAFYSFPDPKVAAELPETITQFLSFLDAAEPCSVSELKSAFDANHAICGLYFANDVKATPAKKLALSELIIQRLGLDINQIENRDEFRKTADAELATRQWDRMIGWAWNSPKVTARLVEPLLDLTREKMDSDSQRQYCDESIFAILSQDVGNVNDLIVPMKESIAYCNEANLQKWVRLYAGNDQLAVRKPMNDPLIRRLKLEPDGPRNEDKVAAILAYQNEVQTSKYRPLIERGRQLETELANLATKGPGTPSILPNRIAEIALAINKQLMIIQIVKDATRFDESTFDEFDRLSQYTGLQLSELVSLPLDRLTDRKKSSQATASDNRRKNSSLERLANFENLDESGLRVLAIDQLERIAHRFESLPYLEAEQLAKYFLAELPLKERLAIEKSMGSFSHWPNLGLALADQIQARTTSRDIGLSIAQRFIENDIKLDGDDWSSELGSRLKKAISKQLSANNRRQPSDENSNWQRLERYLVQLHNERVEMFQSTASPSIDLAPHLATRTLMSRFALTRGENERLQRLCEFATKDASNPLITSATTNQIFARSFTSKLDQAFQADAARVISDFDLTYKLEEQAAGIQLYQSELLLLKTLDIYRRNLIERLVFENWDEP